MPTARLALLPVLVLLLASCAGSPAARDSAPADVVTAAAAGTPASDGGVESPAESDAMVCRREVVTGTNFQREVCRTRAQREAIERETRELVRERRSQSLGK